MTKDIINQSYIGLLFNKCLVRWDFIMLLKMT